MENNDNTYIVYENWQADKKAVVHKGTCGYAKDGHSRLNDYIAPNDRWFGYFHSADSAIAFASLLPRRNLKLCGHCMQTEKNNI